MQNVKECVEFKVLSSSANLLAFYVTKPMFDRTQPWLILPFFQKKIYREVRYA